MTSRKASASKKYITFRKKKNYRNHEINENARGTLPR